MVVPLVSICIPTYNRCDYLKRTLESIIKTDEFRDGRVEIVVSDNCSEDETGTVCKEYQDIYDNFIYIRTEKNIRDANFFFVIKAANGQMRKLWNDTMLAKKNSMKCLCEISEEYYQNKCMILCLNNEKIKAPKFIHMHEVDELIRLAGHNLTWTGMFAVWDYDIPKLDSEGIELSLWQTVQIMNLLTRNNNILCVEFSMTSVDVVKPKNMKYGVFRVFYYNFIESIMMKYVEMDLISIDTVSFIKKKLLYDFFMGLTIQWYRWLLSEGDIIFDDKENLPRLIEEEYGKESYIDDYRALLKIRLTKEFYPYLFYKYEKIKYKVKKLLKRMCDVI